MASAKHSVFHELAEAAALYSRQAQLPKSNIWINVIHAVDGAWGIDGQALTNAQLGEAIYKG